MVPLNALAAAEGGNVPARMVRDHVNFLVIELDLNDAELARAFQMGEAQVHRMRKRKVGAYRPGTVAALLRLEDIIQAGEKIFTKEGLRRWLLTPNPYLYDVPPLQCLRTNKEAGKVMSLIVSIGHGLAA